MVNIQRVKGILKIKNIIREKMGNESKSKNDCEDKREEKLVDFLYLNLSLTLNK